MDISLPESTLCKSLAINGIMGLSVWYSTKNGVTSLAIDMKQSSLTIISGSLVHDTTASYDVVAGLGTLFSVIFT